MGEANQYKDDKTPQLITDVLQWHLYEMERKYPQMLDVVDTRVRRKVNVREQTYTFSNWVWAIVTVLHAKPVDGAVVVWRRMVGDFKQASLNPTALSRRPKPPGLVAGYAAGPSAVPVVDGEAASQSEAHVLIP